MSGQGQGEGEGQGSVIRVRVRELELAFGLVLGPPPRHGRIWRRDLTVTPVLSRSELVRATVVNRLGAATKLSFTLDMSFALVRRVLPGAGRAWFLLVWVVY